MQKINRIIWAYFTGTGTTQKVATLLAQELGRQLWNGPAPQEAGLNQEVPAPQEAGLNQEVPAPQEAGMNQEVPAPQEAGMNQEENAEKATSEKEIMEIDFSLPRNREKPLEFRATDLVILAVPVVAGRVPNLLKKYLETINGQGALGVPLVLYGNRDYQDAVVELKDLMTKGNCDVIGCGAFVGQHSFASKLAAGRPDIEDKKNIIQFGEELARKILGAEKKQPSDRTESKGELAIEKELERINGELPGKAYPYGDYYQPRRAGGEKIDIRKVKPQTAETCNLCNLCIENCRMEAINKSNPKEITGTCIKCCHCIKICPEKAKFFDDQGFLYHKEDLEKKFIKRREPEYWL